MDCGHRNSAPPQDLLEFERRKGQRHAAAAEQGGFVMPSLTDMLAEANAAVPKISPAEAMAMMKDGNVLIIDVRDPPEVQNSGKVAGALNMTRAMLEVRADPESPSFDKRFTKDKKFILYCSAGSRAALAGFALKSLGYRNVYNMGGFKDWAASGGAIQESVEKGI
jgi:rhodanese-related sulfurtransferase